MNQPILLAQLTRTEMKVVKIRTSASSELAFDIDQAIVCDQLEPVRICGSYGEGFVRSRSFRKMKLKFYSNMHVLKI